MARYIGGEFYDLPDDPHNDEYTSPRLIELMKRPEVKELLADRETLNSELRHRGYPPFEALEDAYPEEFQLEALAAVLKPRSGTPDERQRR